MYATKVHKKKPIIKQLYRKVTTDLKTSSKYSQASFMCAQEIPFQTTVISASKYKEYTLIFPERHTSFYLINRSFKQLLPTDYQYIENLQIKKLRGQFRVRVTYSPVF